MDTTLRIIAALIHCTTAEEEHLQHVKELLEVARTGKQITFTLHGGCTVFAKLIQSKIEVFCHEKPAGCPKLKALERALVKHFTK